MMAEQLAETGITGSVLWALFILAVVLALRRQPRTARTIGYSVLVAWLVASIFLDVPNTYQATGLVVIALAAALRADWTNERRAAAQAVAVDHGTATAKWLRPSRRERLQPGPRT